MKKYIFALSAAVCLCACGESDISSKAIENLQANLNLQIEQANKEENLKDFKFEKFICSASNGVTCKSAGMRASTDKSSMPIGISEFFLNTNWLYDGEQESLSAEELINMLPAVYKSSFQINGLDLSALPDFNAKLKEMQNEPSIMMLLKPFDIAFDLSFDKNSDNLASNLNVKFSDNHKITADLTGSKTAKMLDIFKQMDCKFSTQTTTNAVAHFDLSRNCDKSKMPDHEVISKAIGDLIPSKFSLNVDIEKLPAQANVIIAFMSEPKLAAALSKLINEGKMQAEITFKKGIDYISIKNPKDLIQNIKINGEDLNELMNLL